MKKFIALIMCAIMTIAMLVPVSADEAADYGKYSAENPLKLTLSHFAASETNQLHLLASAFKEKVEAATDGAVQVEIVMGGQLGNDQESLELVMAGALDMAVNNTPIMSQYYEKFMILDLPYLFKDYDHIYAFLESDIAQNLMSEFGEATGARMLCMQAVGYRNFESSKGFVHSAADLAGVKTRCTGSTVYVDTWNTWGASAMTMAGSEVLTALQQKTIDACDNVNNVAMADGYYEFAPYISIMEYAVHFNGLTINNALYEGLTTDLQEAISAAAIEAAAERTAALQEENENALDSMVNNEKGTTVEVYELTDEEKNGLREAAEPVYESFIAKYDAADDVAAIEDLAK